MADQQMQSLERKVDELVTELDRENRLLKANADSWKQEREKLLEKTDLARSKVESMIQRLRALEQES